MSALISGNFLPAESAATADFVGMINDLFDSCNGNSKHPPDGTKYRCVASDSSHLQFWTDTYEELKKYYFVCSSSRDEPPKKKRKITSEEIKKKVILSILATQMSFQKKEELHRKD